MITQGMAVGLGAALGAVARWALIETIGSDLWVTLLINVVGSMALGYFQPGPFWGSGFFGGFTTMSAYALLTAQLGAAEAAGYTVLTVGLCLAGVLAGRRFARVRSTPPGVSE